MKKKVVSLFVTLVAIVSLIVPSAFANASSGAGTPNEEALTSKGIRDRLIQIDEKYEVGERLSDSDAAFIEKFGTKDAAAGDVQAMATKSIYGRDTNGSHSGYTSGSIWSSTGLTYGSYGGNFTTYDTSSATPSRIENYLTHTAYGYGGGDFGLFKVYEKTLTSKCYGLNSCNFNDGDRYSGVVAYHTTISKAKVYYSNGYNLIIMPD